MLSSLSEITSQAPVYSALFSRGNDLQLVIL